MLPDLPVAPALLALVALTPGLRTWWSGRRLAAQLDDPAFPERLHSSQRLNGIVLAFCAVLLAVLAAGSLFWTLPLLALTLIASGYPLRKAIHDETWSLGTYLAFFGRLIASWFGFWTVLGAVPAVSQLAGTRDWLIALPCAAVLLAWNARFADVFRWTVGVTPLEPGPLLDRCRALAGSVGLDAIRLERIDTSGGVVPNALALPSLRQPSVIFSSTLLDRFPEEEIVAICAHELAHHEYYNRERLLRLNRLSVLLIMSGAAWAPAARLLEIDSMMLVEAAWLGVVAVTLILLGRDKQHQESVCDKRAAEMTGQPEIVIAALTRLYMMARVPRRMDSDHEHSATHPSLARRIRDIRKASGALPASLAAAVTFRGADERTAATFEDEALAWSDHDASHRLPYAQLSELRVDARGGAAPRLVAARAGMRLEMTLPAADVPRVQEVLDVIDGRLGDPLRPRPVPIPAARVLLWLAVALIFALGQGAAAFVALLAVIRPAPQLLLASALAILTAASLVLRTYGTAHPLTWLITLPLAIVGIVLLLGAWRKRGEQGGGRAGYAVAILGLTSIGALALLALDGLDLVRLHSAARASTAVPVLLVALAGALAASRIRREQLAGAAAAALGALAVLVSSPAFLDAFGHDPLLIDSPRIALVELRHAEREGLLLPSTAGDPRLSPDGRHVIVSNHAGMHEDGGSTFLAGPSGGALSPLRADDAVFTGNEHVLTAISTDEGTTLELIRLDDRSAIWSQTLPDIHSAELSVDIVTRRWSLVGWTGEMAIAHAGGTVGHTDIERRQWRLAPLENAYVEAVAPLDAAALVVQTRFDRGPLGRLLPPQWTWTLSMQPFRRESRVLLLDHRGTIELGASRLEAKCSAAAAPRGSLVCTVDDGTRTRFVEIDAATGSIAPIGFLPGRFVSDGHTTRGWLTGWAEDRPVAIRLATRQAFHTSPDGEAMSLSVSGDRIAAASFDGDALRIAVYVPGD
jgi:Zn-dependent protease with chaperone function